MGPKAYNNLVPYWIRTGLLLILLVIMMNWLRSFFLGMFFYPDNVRNGDPSQMNVPFEDIRFATSDNRTLRGYFFKPSGRPKGTVIHCHGNAGNITGHYSLVLFLVRDGYNVLAFDYGGYGESEGQPSPAEIVQDTLSAIAYARTRKDVDSSRLVLFGQSLGGAAASGAMAQDQGIRCLVLEGAFTTYQEIAKSKALGKILFFLTPVVIPDVGPKHDLPKIAPRPVIILHGEEDHLVPVRFGNELYKFAADKKALVILKDFGHLQGDDGMPIYRNSILRFLSENLN